MLSIESNDQSKPEMLFYSIIEQDVVETKFEVVGGRVSPNGKIITHQYLIQTNDKIPVSKFEEIETFIHKLLNNK